MVQSAHAQMQHITTQGDPFMNQIAIVTGSTSGIGKATTLQLLEAGIDVIGIGRDKAKIDSLMETSLTIAKNASLTMIRGDLKHMDEVRIIAKHIKQFLEDRPIDFVFLVAGSVATWYTQTAEGYELQFAVNHLASFLLLHEIMDSLKKAQDAQVFVVSSASHRNTKLDFSDLMSRNHYHNLAVYKKTKLMNVLFVKQWNETNIYPNIRIHAIDPGLVRTDIGLKNTMGIERFVWRIRSRGGVDPMVPAKQMIAIAKQPNLNPRSGGYFRNGIAIQPSKAAQSKDSATKLWNYSLRLLGLTEYFR
jgi:NAD(P)-dependent dehydrogenase (short-subunit alcohol dehydrogenase family)